MCFLFPVTVVPSYVNVAIFLENLSECILSCFLLCFFGYGIGARSWVLCVTS